MLSRHLDEHLPKFVVLYVRRGPPLKSEIKASQFNPFRCPGQLNSHFGTPRFGTPPFPFGTRDRPPLPIKKKERYIISSEDPIIKLDSILLLNFVFNW